MPRRKEHASSDIYVKRERWHDGYHSVARRNGMFVSTRKWTGEDSTKQTLKHAWKGNVVEESDRQARYSYLFQGTNEQGQPRNYSVSSSHRVFIGSKKHRKLDTEPLKKHAKVKYGDNPLNPSPKVLRIRKLKSVYQWGVKIA
jgi:hypothetical protein